MSMDIDPVRMMRCVGAAYIIVKSLQSDSDVVSKSLSLGTALLIAGAPPEKDSETNGK